ncbi:MAG: hypothetical protein ACREO1_15130 [Arenimonas sp.]
MTQSIQKCFIILLATLAILLSAPVDAKSKRGQLKKFEVAQMKYASSIRWNEFEMAWGYVDPVYRNLKPLTDLEIERLKQVQVVGYTEKTMDVLENGNVEIRVEIRLVNRNTQAERVVIDTQVWRWDAEGKRWWLTTGLPDFSAKPFG